MSETKYIRIKEDNDKCCLCIDREIGVKLISVWTILTTARFVKYGLDLTRWDSNIYFIGYCICLFPLILSAWYFIQYLMHDEASTRDKLPRACTFVIYSSIA